MLFFEFLSLVAMTPNLLVGAGETVSRRRECPRPWRRRAASCASRLRRTHHGNPVFVDLDHVASRVWAAREAFEACRSPRNDRMGVGAGFDRITLLHLLVEERVEAILANP